MQFSKWMFSCIPLFVAFCAVSQVVDTSWVDENQKQQKLILEEMQKSGQLKIFEQQDVEEKTQKYSEISQEIAQKSVKKETFSMEQYEGLDGVDGNQPSTIDTYQAQQSASLKAIFVSFSMTNKELYDAFSEAGQTGAEIYFNGMHPDDENIGQTMRRLQKMAGDLEVRPSARFHPKAFEEFQVQSVPYIISVSKGRSLSVAGVLNFAWLEEKGNEKQGRHHFGTQGAVRPVIERNLLEEIELRLSRIDFEEKKKQAVAKFWSKQKFITLPRAQKNDAWMIDPTVKVTKDIVNPKGEVLARKGDIVNPLDAVPALNTYVLFNARDVKQLEWAYEQKTSGKLVGTVMFLSSELDSEKGWDHLTALRDQFKQEIYMVPKEMVERFNITGLPAIVSTDLERKMLKVQQFSLE